MNRFVRPAFLLASIIVASCTQPSAPSPQAVKAPPPPVPVEAVARIRAAGAGMDSAVQVEPLGNPAVEGLLKRARAAESAGDYEAAAKSAHDALALAPDAPDILQYEAELEALRGHWKKSEELAVKSFTLGPKLGSLCARNWQTVVEARIAFNDTATVKQAKQRLAECRIAPPVRM